MTLIIVLFVCAMILYVVFYNEDEHQRRLEVKRKKKKRYGEDDWEEFRTTRRVARHDRHEYSEHHGKAKLARKVRKTL